MIIVDQFPFPPSENELRQNAPVYSQKLKRTIVRQRNTDTYKAYKANVEQWRLERLVQIATLKTVVKTWPTWDVQAFYVMNPSRILCKDGSVKKFDVSNRDKALHDCLAPIFGVDDSKFFRVTGEKILRNFEGPEYVVLLLRPGKVRTLADLADELNPLTAHRIR